MKEAKLDRMFDAVRETPVEQSFQSTSRQFLKAKGVGFFGVALVSWGLLSNTLKIVIMISTLITAAAIATTIVLQSTPKTTVLAPSKQATLPMENKEIVVDEVGNKSITYYDDSKKVLRNETILKPKEKAAPERMALLPVVKLREIEPLKLKPGVPIQKTIADSTELVKTFVIEKNMLDSELEAIQNKAIAAGIEFRYKMVVWKGKTKRISFTMRLITDEATCDYDSILTGNFRKTIGWVEGADGKAVRLLN